MPLEMGTRIGAFEITGALGAGGMGEVYRARDTRLQRDVALKILPALFAADADRLARFEREAQILASLNHTHIAAIYGIESRGEQPVLVLELVEGPTLADRIAHGPIPQDETVSIARQIADALESAHEQGIVHRDLKPANVKLRSDGTVKVLDFGLAKLADPVAGSGRGDASLPPTITSPAMTGVGVILGTAAYMSPEQAAGKPAGKRADIWAFGVVLWEMLVGQRLFGDGESTSHVLADVLRAPIDFERIPPGPLRGLLRRCLDRDVKTRLRDIGEARIVLSQPLEPAAAPVGAARRSTVTVAWTAATLLAIATGIALWAPWRVDPEQPLTRLEVDLGSDVALPASTTSNNVVVSPDGTRLAFIGSIGGGASRLHIKRLNTLDDDAAVELPGTEGASGVAFSPDGQSLAFVAGNRVFRVSADGGAALRLAETETSITHVTWGDGDNIIVSGGGSGLWRIPPNSGKPVPLTELVAPEVIHASQSVLPGGKNVLFIAGSPNNDVTTIEAVPTAGGARKVIVANGGSPHYIATGHLLYLLRDTLFAVGFDVDTLETRGNPVPIVADVKATYSGFVAVGQFAVSSGGTLVYRRATAPLGPVGAWNLTQSTVQWIDPAGRRSPLVATAGSYFDPRLSPDGGRLLLTVVGQSGPNVAVYDARRDSVPRNLSFDGSSVDPAWIDKNGEYVAYLVIGGVRLARSGRLHWRRIDGGEPQPLLPDALGISTGSFNAETNRLAFVAVESQSGPGRGRSGRRGIFTVSVAEDGGQLKAGVPERFSPREFTELDPQYSPDGRWLAFVTDKSGRSEVWVRAASAGQAGLRYERQMSSSGGTNPRWSRTKNELLFQSGDVILAAPYTIRGESLEPDKPTVRVEKVGGTQWDLARDGRIALIVQVNPADQNEKAPSDHTVVFLQNFFDEVRRRVK
jgi:serine/threonine-protein kinase